MQEIKISVSDKVFSKLTELAELEGITLEKFISNSIIKRAEYEHKLKKLHELECRINRNFEEYRNIKGR